MIQTSSVKVVNDGTELRINRIRQSDLSDYTCVARNGEGRIHQTVRVVIAGSVIGKLFLEKVTAPVKFSGTDSNCLDYSQIKIIFTQIFWKRITREMGKIQANFVKDFNLKGLDSMNVLIRAVYS